MSEDKIRQLTDDEINTQNQIQRYQERIEELEKIIKALAGAMDKLGRDMTNIPVGYMAAEIMNMSKNLQIISKNTIETAFPKV